MRKCDIRRVACAYSLVLAIVYVTPLVRSEARAAEPVLHSPRLKMLAAAIASGKTAEVDTFWAEMKAKGTPVVEAMPGNEHHVWLTFLWRGDHKTKNVVLVGGIAVGQPIENRLTRLPGTDVWSLTLPMRDDLRASYRFSVNDPLDKPDWTNEAAARSRVAGYRTDPLCLHRGQGTSMVELASAPPQPWAKRHPMAPAGKMERVNIRSTILGNERQVTFYLPPGYDATATPYPVLYLFDRTAYLYLVPTPTILDNLIHAERIPPTVAVLIDNAPDARNKELPCNEAFARFLAEELMPRVRKDYNVALDPRRVTFAGSSYGGLAASFFALRHPELVGNVLSQSGSYWWSPQAAEAERDRAIEREWLTRQYALAPRGGVRFYLEVGLREEMCAENRHFRDVLQARGYEVVRYSEFNGGHEYMNWRGSLADGLIALLGGKAEADR